MDRVKMKKVNTKRILDIEHLYFKYVNSGSDKSNGFSEYILEDISFNLDRGEFVAIIGENGSGKTTLLKNIMGLLKPQKGRISLFGEEISKFNKWSKIGYVPQKLSLPRRFPLSVSDFVGLGLQATKGLFSKINKSDEKSIIDALKQVDMEDYIHKKLSNLSGGQFQRVLLAKELAKKPELILLDEPTVGVDIHHQKKFCCLLSKLNKQAISILIVTHDISFVSYHVNRVIGINHTIVFDGKPKKLTSSVLKDIFGHAAIYSGLENMGAHCGANSGK